MVVSFLQRFSSDYKDHFASVVKLIGLFYLSASCTIGGRLQKISNYLVLTVSFCYSSARTEKKGSLIYLVEVELLILAVRDKLIFKSVKILVSIRRKRAHHLYPLARSLLQEKHPPPVPALKLIFFNFWQNNFFLTIPFFQQSLPHFKEILNCFFLYRYYF